MSRSSVICRRRRALLMLCFASLGFWGSAHADDLIEVRIDQSQVAAIDGREWNKAGSQDMTVDAVHRAALLRFPDALAAAQEAATRGLSLIEARIELDYDSYEVRPGGYVVRDGLGKAKWQQMPPHWHVFAMPLRRRWGDGEVGGTSFLYASPGEQWQIPGAQE